MTTHSSSLPSSPAERAARLLAKLYHLGHTPSSLARVTGLSRTSLWRIETGKLRPRQVVIQVLKLALRVTRTEDSAAGGVAP